MHPLYSKPPLHLNDNVRSYFGCPQSIINQAACSYSCSCTCNRNSSHIVVLKLYLCKINFTPVHGNVIALIGQNYLLMFREIKARELSMINIVAVGTHVIKPGYFIYKKVVLGSPEIFLHYKTQNQPSRTSIYFKNQPYPVY